ncbi:MAG: tripartite tricarboxylate transporter substrate binding protein [Burkholderiales bacterium]|nr:tripartite tricarboxylate transporter substrate binding protein [Burkholderiales bacterium]
MSKGWGFTRGVVFAWTVAALATGISGHAGAQAKSFPSKPLRAIAAFPAGSSTDSITRVVAEHLRVKLGQPVVVDNRAGANGAIGVTEAARASADGYTLLGTNSSSITVNPQLYKKIAYLPARDFVPLTMVVSAPFFLVVNPSGAQTAAVNSVADLVAVARAKPGQLSFGSGGLGNLAHLGFSMLNNRAGIKTVHVPYKSGAGAQTALLGREIDTMLVGPAVVPIAQAGKLKALAVTTVKRWPEMPEVPTMIESGFADFDVPFWLGLLVPAQTPAAVIKTLYGAIASIRDDPSAVRQLSTFGSVELLDPQTFAARIRAETAAWGEVIRREKIQLD